MWTAGLCGADGHLPGETPAEVNRHKLLRVAQGEFKEVKTFAGEDWEQSWPRLRAAPGNAFLNWHNVSGQEIIKSHAMSNAETQTFPLWRKRFIQRN